MVKFGDDSSETLRDGATRKSARGLFGDGQTATRIREKILVWTTDLFYTYGIHAVELDRTLREVGVTKTTFYHHFESKDKLACEVLRHKPDWEFEKFVKAVDEASEGIPRPLSWPRVRGSRFRVTGPGRAAPDLPIPSTERPPRAGPYRRLHRQVPG